MGSPREPKKSTSLIGAIEVVEASLAMGEPGRRGLVAALVRLADELSRRVAETEEGQSGEPNHDPQTWPGDFCRAFLEDQRGHILEVRRFARLVETSPDSPAQQVMLRRALGEIRRVCLDSQRRGIPRDRAGERIWR